MFTLVSIKKWSCTEDEPNQTKNSFLKIKVCTPNEQMHAKKETELFVDDDVLFVSV